MLFSKFRVIFFLIIITGLSYFGVKKVSYNPEKSGVNAKSVRYPEYYMENFTIFIMDENGAPKNRLKAEHMAYYKDSDTSEFRYPEYEILNQDKPPTIINSNMALIKSNNKFILLDGDVYLYRNDVFGKREVELITDKVRILPDDEYLETDELVTLITKQQTIISKGMRVYVEKQRVEFLSDVHTTIKSNNTY